MQVNKTEMEIKETSPRTDRVTNLCECVEHCGRSFYGDMMKNLPQHLLPNINKRTASMSHYSIKSDHLKCLAAWRGNKSHREPQTQTLPVHWKPFVYHCC